MSDLQFSQKTLTPIFRVSFPSLFKPNNFNGTEKYEVTALFEKGTDLTNLKRIAKEALVLRFGEEIPKGIQSPIKDGDEKFTADGKAYNGYPGHVYVKFSSRLQPATINRQKEEIIDESEVYGGCYGRAIVQCGAYGGKSSGFKPGYHFYIQHFQKTGEGEPFAQRTKAADEFPDDLGEDFGSEDTGSDDEFDF